MLQGRPGRLREHQAGRSAEPDLEEEILNDIVSHGRQLGRIGDVLGVLLKHVSPPRSIMPVG